MSSATRADLNSGLLEVGTFVRPPGADLVPIRKAHMDEDVLEIWKSAGPCLAYPKADGWRIQIHKRDQMVALYSRGGQDYADEFQQVVAAVRDCFPDLSVVLDVELVGFDAAGNYVEPPRLRKASRFLCYVLDVLQVGEQDWTSLPTLHRIQRLRDELGPYLLGSIIPAGFTFIRSGSDLLHLYRHCFEDRMRGLDGTIIKRLSTPYFSHVLKLKSSDRVDAVVVGAYCTGRFSLESVDRLLLAVPDPMRQLWVPIAIVTRNNTDWERVWEACVPYVLDRPLRDITRLPHPPAFWFSPKVVVSVMFENVRRTKKYELNATSPRACVLREDKGPEEATVVQQLEAIQRLSEAPHLGGTSQPSLFDVISMPSFDDATRQSDESYFTTRISRWPELPVQPKSEPVQLPLFGAI